VAEATKEGRENFTFLAADNEIGKTFGYVEVAEYGVFVWTLEDPSKVNEGSLAPSTEGALFVVEV
jgi:hypothetical protein